MYCFIATAKSSERFSFHKNLIWLLFGRSSCLSNHIFLEYSLLQLWLLCWRGKLINALLSTCISAVLHSCRLKIIIKKCCVCTDAKWGAKGSSLHVCTGSLRGKCPMSVAWSCWLFWVQRLLCAPERWSSRCVWPRNRGLSWVRLNCIFTWKLEAAYRTWFFTEQNLKRKYGTVKIQGIKHLVSSLSLVGRQIC